MQSITSFRWAVCILLGLYLLPVVAAEEYPQLDEILTRMDSFRMEEYAYTQTREEEGGLTIERYDPAMPGEFKWQLVLREGKPPTDKDLKKYQKDKQKELARRQQGNEQQTYSSYIKPGTLVLVEETPQFADYTFQAATPEDTPFAKMMEKVQGQLRINKPGKFLESLRMSSPEPFSPVIGVEVTSFSMQMIFAPVTTGAAGLKQETEAVLLSETHFSFSGTVLLLKKMSQQVVIHYSDFLYRGAVQK